MDALAYLRWPLMACGLLFLFVALFLYEDEEGALQNRLEVWWCKLDDGSRSALSVNLRILKGLAKLSQRRLDSLLGNRSVSYQSIGVLICWGMISAKLIIIIVASTARGMSGRFLAGQLATMAFWWVLSFLLASRPTGKERTVFLLILAAWAMFIVAAYAAGTTANAVEGPPVDTTGEGRRLMRVGLAILPLYTFGVLISIPVSLTFVGISRWSLRRLSRAITPRNAVGAATVHGAFLLGMVLLHLLASYLLVSTSDLREYLFQTITPVMGEAYLMSLSYVAFLGHLAFWGVLKRPLYALQRATGERRKQLLLGFGLLLLGWSLPKAPAVFESILSLPGPLSD